MGINRNLLWQLFGQGTGKAAMFLFYILLPSAIGIEEYGRYSFALAICFILVQPVVEMGLDMVVAKWVSRGMPGVVRKAFNIRCVSALVVIPALFAASVVLKADKTVVFILSAYFVLVAFQGTAFSYFRGVEKMKAEGIIVPAQRVLALLLFFVLIGLGLRDKYLGPLTMLLSAIAGAAMLVVSSGGKIREVLKDKAGVQYGVLIKEGVVLGGVIFLWQIYFRIDSIMLGAMMGDAEVGTYNVAYRLMEAVNSIPGIILIAYFPRLVRREEFAATAKKLFYILAGGGLAAGAALYLLSPYLIRSLYREEFLSSAPVLKALSFAVLPVYLGHLATQSLVALDMSRAYFAVAFGGMLLNVFLNYLLIPQMGASGAAWATVATEFAVVALCGYFVIRRKEA